MKHLYTSLRDYNVALLFVFLRGSSWLHHVILYYREAEDYFRQLHADAEEGNMQSQLACFDMGAFYCLAFYLWSDFRKV